MSQSPYRTPSTTSGLCECGCGRTTRLARRTNDGIRKGHPMRFIQGHSGGNHLRTENLYTVDSESGCWLWNYRTTKAGYGQYRNPTGKTVYAHRWMYEMVKGPIPEGLELDHKITCPKCCINPDHVEPVTGQINVQRGRQAKLYPEAVIDIRTSNEPARVLAARYRIGRRQIYYVRSRHTWYNIQEATL